MDRNWRSWGQISKQVQQKWELQIQGEAQSKNQTRHKMIEGDSWWWSLVLAQSYTDEHDCTHIEHTHTQTHTDKMYKIYLYHHTQNGYSQSSKWCDLKSFRKWASPRSHIGAIILIRLIEAHRNTHYLWLYSLGHHPKLYIYERVSWAWCLQTVSQNKHFLLKVALGSRQAHSESLVPYPHSFKVGGSL